ncbi:MAG: 4-hydroxy-tetrahydrodipicolinate synthase [Chloroflexota bacterium]|nr:4-hydroxy-tetrahydrodipicolinate synthase [Chloroflexota bacterium]
MTRAVESPTMSQLAGSFTALITPFSNDTIDEPALRALVDFQVSAGIHGLVPCGTTGEVATMTGEVATMTAAEQGRVIAIVVEQAAGRVPIVAGIGTNSTRTTIARTRRAQELGADAALIVTPYYNKPTQEGLFAHFSAIADGTDLPIILYNVPGRTGVNLLPDTLARLARMPTIAGIKEASGVLDQVSQIVNETPDDFVVLSGDDSLTLPIMSVGSRGVVSVVANVVPGAVAALTDAWLGGDAGAARAMHRGLFDLCRAMFIETNPVPVKAAASLLGLCDAEVRLPLVPLSEPGRRRLEAALAACPHVPARAIAA